MTRLRGSILMLAAALASGCGQLPSDPEGTLERVREGHVVRIGLVASKERSLQERQFVAELASTLDARVSLETGAADEVLGRLEEGKLDLVLGEFHRSSPWDSRVTFLPALKKSGGDKTRTVLAAAARNGENGWIALLHHHASLLEQGK